MKTRVPIFKLLLLISLCSALAATAVFGQTSPDTALLIWGGPGTDIDYTTNWGNTANVAIPTLTTLEWNGVTTSNLNLTYNASALASGSGGNGYNLYLTSAQTNSVTIGTTLGTANPLAITDIQIDAGAGAFTLGGATSATVMEWIGRPGGFFHTLINNSTNTATITPNLFFQAGGGAQFTLDFSGTGNWVVSNYLGNNNGPNIAIQQDGPGTLIWNPSGYVDANGIASPITITGGALILTGNHPKINTQAITLSQGATFVFDAPGQSQTLAGVISGPGLVQVNNGTLTLAGQSTFSSNLVLNGGTVVADSTENAMSAGPLGEGNNIVFNGGTLEFTSIDYADYSAVFSTAAGQLYNINANGQTLVFATGLTSSNGSLTLAGPGSLTLAGTNTYSGTTTVNSGTLVFQGPMSGTGNITVADSATLGVTEGATQVKPATMTLGSISGAILQFNNVTNKTTAPLAVGTLSSAGTTTININSGAFTTIGQVFPLFTWTNGPAPAVTIGTVNGAAGTLSTNGNTIDLTITATPYVWTGLGADSWDLTTTGDWVQSGKSVVFANGAIAVFDDTATGTSYVDLGSTVSPASVTFNNSLQAYTIDTETGLIGGAGGLTKNGTNTLTMTGGANTYTGVTTINAGIVNVGVLSRGGKASDIGAANNSASNLVLNGGTLNYTGSGASIDRLFTIGTSGGAIEASGTGALNFTNTGLIGLSGSGGRVLTLEGNGGTAITNILASVLSDKGGATQLALSGTTTWAVAGNNTNTGLTTVNPGTTLLVGAGGTNGSLGGSVKDNGALIFDNTGTVTNSAISGTGSVTVASGTVVLSANNTYTGGTTVNSTLQVGTGGAAGALFDAGSLVNNGLVIFNDTAGQTLVNTAVTGTGGFIFQSGFTEISAYGDTYSGWVQINPGATFQPTYGNEPVPPISAITNNGTLYMTRQDGIPPITAANPVVFNIPANIVGTGKLVKENNNQNPGSIGLSGTNTYSGGTLIAGGAIVLGDNTTVGGGSIVGRVIFTNTTTSFDNPRTLEFYRPDNFVFTNNISSVVTVSAGGNLGTVEQSGSGTVTLTGNNNYGGGTIIDASTTLQVGAGGTSGNLGGGQITDNGALIYDRSDSVTVTNLISGTGTITQLGSGTLTLTASNTYTGATIVSNGTLVLNYSGDAGTNAVGSDMDLYGGTLVVGGVGTTATLTVAGSLNMPAGVIVANLNKSLVPSNTVYSVAGPTSSTGAALKLLNFGPSLVVGDKFTIFSGPVAGGAAMTIVSPGFTVTNNLGVDGSVTVTGVASAKDQMTATRSGQQLNLAWPAAYLGLDLQTQTNNSPTNGISTNSANWVTIPGTAASNGYSITIGTNSSVFFRLSPQ